MYEMLSEKESLKCLNGMGYTQSTFAEWDRDSCKENFAGQEQFSPYTANFDRIPQWGTLIRKFYVVKLSKGFQIRAWAIR